MYPVLILRECRRPELVQLKPGPVVSKKSLVAVSDPPDGGRPEPDPGRTDLWEVQPVLIRAEPAQWVLFLLFI